MASSQHYRQCGRKDLKLYLTFWIDTNFSWLTVPIIYVYSFKMFAWRTIDGISTEMRRNFQTMAKPSMIPTILITISRMSHWKSNLRNFTFESHSGEYLTSLLTRKYRLRNCNDDTSFGCLKLASFTGYLTDWSVKQIIALFRDKKKTFEISVMVS